MGSPHPETPEDPPKTKNAAPSAKGNGVGSAYETAKFQDEEYTDDGVMSKVDIPDRRRYTIKLADGWPMAFTCDPDGLMSAYDFLAHDGRVLRIERRITTVVPPLFYGRGTT